jgi:sugar phosphate permease
VILAAGVLAITAACSFQFGLPFLLPRLRADGFTLGQAAVLIAAPNLGLLTTLYAWGSAADRWGERVVLVVGLAATVPFLAAAALLSSGPERLGTVAVLLALGGASSAAVHAASGRLIAGWFHSRERGFAMGIRQTAQPLGVGLAALTLPPFGELGLAPALLLLTGISSLAALVTALVVRDAPVPPDRIRGPGPSPYRTPFLWRVHAASAALVLPQFTVGAFGLAFLVETAGWSPTSGGQVLALTQLVGASGRLLSGWWSDRAGSRTGPMRHLSVLIGASVAVLAVSARSPGMMAVIALLVATVITVSPNGLAYTAVAERAGPSWTGRSLGIQNTTQNMVATITPALMALVIADAGYVIAFGVAALFPLLAALVVPVDTGRFPTDRGPDPDRDTGPGVLPGNVPG